jgi:hypothetical protein
MSDLPAVLSYPKIINSYSTSTNVVFIYEHLLSFDMVVEDELKNTRPPEDVTKSLKELEERYGISHEKITEAWNEIISDPNFEFNSFTDWNIRSRQVANLVKVYVYSFTHLDPELKELYNRVNYVVIDEKNDNWRISIDGKELIIPIVQLEDINYFRTEYIRRFHVPLRFQYVYNLEYNPKWSDFIEAISLGKRILEPGE